MKASITARYATYVDEAKPSTCFYLKTGFMGVDGTAGKRKQAVVWFSSPFGPDGGNVTRATLRIRSRAISYTGTHTITARLASKWAGQFGRLTWATRPSAGGLEATVSKSGPRGANEVWEFDVTRQLQAVADGQGMYGFVLHSNVAEMLYLQGQMGAGLNPVLDVEWSMAPKPPASLAPAGGRAVGEPNPVMRWSFYDHGGEQGKASSQVQLSKTTSFTTPWWDSGEVTSEQCSLDLSTTTFPGLTSGQVVYWRVRNRDTAGLWSGWSQTQTFRYLPRPVVTLQSPSHVAPFIVDPTPVIAWSVAGGTQTAYRVGIYVWDGKRWGFQGATGMTRGSETSWTPSKPLVYRDALYKFVVDVFDDEDREATPGCPEYTSDSEEVRFKPDADTTSAYKLTAKPLDGKTPAVSITWQHPQTPDQWRIYRDGILFASYDGPDLIRGSAPNYGITDRWVAQGEHTWIVRAIVNGESWPSAPVTSTVSHIGTWLVNLETQQAVCIVGDLDHDLTMPEDVTVHVPLGASHGYAVTAGRRGYEGIVQGDLLDGTHTTSTQNAKTWRRNLLDFKTDTGQEYLLLIEDLALPVKISNVTVAGMPERPGEAWQASYAFRQVGEFLF